MIHDEWVIREKCAYLEEQLNQVRQLVLLESHLYPNLTKQLEELEKEWLQYKQLVEQEYPPKARG